MDFNLHIKLGNAAMNSREDVADALTRVAQQLRNGGGAGTILDNNGNSVGEFSFEGALDEFEITEQALALDGESHDLDSALDTIWGHGMADDEAGTTESPFGHVFQVGKYTRHTNSDGIKTTTEHQHEMAAIEHMDDLHDAEAEA